MAVEAVTEVGLEMRRSLPVRRGSPVRRSLPLMQCGLDFLSQVGTPRFSNTCNLGTPSEIWARWRRKRDAQRSWPM